MDPDGYPDEEELTRIETWDAADLLGLLRFVRSLWWMPDWGWSEVLSATFPRVRFDLSTGGWSGNESLIEALKKNLYFWASCWVSSRRGGHYEFEVPEEEEGTHGP